MSRRTAKLYQEVPYSSRYPEYTPAALESLCTAGVELSAEVYGIEDVFEERMRLISGYASQFKIAVMRPDIHASGELAADSTHRLAEQMWTARSLPLIVIRESLTLEAAAERREATAVAMWLDRHRDCRRVRILLQLPTDRWDRDLEFLSKALPKPKFDVLASPEATPEVMAVTNDRVKLRTIRKGARAWVTLALELTVSSALPTLFLVSSERQREARLMSMAWVRSDTVVLTSMDCLYGNPRSAESISPETTA